jgi:hypothetical protein
MDQWEANTRSPSTTFGWRRVKVTSPPQAHGTALRRSTFWRWLPARDPRKPLTIKVSYRGGPECWVEVHGRGGIGRYPGVTQLIDIVRDVNNVK